MPRKKATDIRSPISNRDSIKADWNNLRFEVLDRERKEAEAHLQECRTAQRQAAEHKAKIDDLVWWAELDLRFINRRIRNL